MTAGDDTSHRQIGASEDGDRHDREAAMAPQNFSIRSMVAADWPAVRAIYEMGIATGDATFETSAPEWDSSNESHMQNSRRCVERGRRLGSPLTRVRSLFVRRCGREQRVRPPRLAWSRCRAIVVERGRCRCRGSGYLDYSDRRLPRKRGESQPALERRISSGRPTRTNRATRRDLARHPPARTTQQARRPLTLLTVNVCVVMLLQLSVEECCADRSRWLV
jgi:hypothetical protein